MAVNGGAIECPKILLEGLPDVSKAPDAGICDDLLIAIPNESIPGRLNIADARKTKNEQQLSPPDWGVIFSSADSPPAGLLRGFLALCLIATALPIV